MSWQLDKNTTNQRTVAQRQNAWKDMLATSTDSPTVWSHVFLCMDVQKPLHIRICILAPEHVYNAPPCTSTRMSCVICYIYWLYLVTFLLSTAIYLDICCSMLLLYLEMLEAEVTQWWVQAGAGQLLILYHWLVIIGWKLLVLGIRTLIHNIPLKSLKSCIFMSMALVSFSRRLCFCGGCVSVFSCLWLSVTFWRPGSECGMREWAAPRSEFKECTRRAFPRICSSWRKIQEVGLILKRNHSASDPCDC